MIKRKSGILRIKKTSKSISGKSVILTNSMPNLGTRLNRSVYLSANPRTPSGDGTFTNPYDASTGPKFDAIMSGIPPNTHIRLLSGIFTTYGAAITGTGRAGEFYVKSGWKIHGEGIGKTIVRIAVPAAAGFRGYNYGAFVSRRDMPRVGDVEISNLSIDCNMASVGHSITNIRAISAISLEGTRCNINKCEVFNFGSYEPYSSVSTIYLGGGYDNAVNVATDNTIQYCTVHSPYIPIKEANNCIHIGGGWFDNKFCEQVAPRVLDNVIYGYSPRTGGSGDCALDMDRVTGIVIESTRYAVIERNAVHGIRTAGPAWTKHHTIYPIIRNNQFYNVITGISITVGATIAEESSAKSDAEYVIITNNSFGLKMSVKNPTAIAIRDLSSTVNLVKGAIIRHNSVFWTGIDCIAVSPYDTFSAFDLDSVSGLYLFQNYINLPKVSASSAAPVYIRTNCGFGYVNGNSCVVDSGAVGSRLPQTTGILIPYRNQ